MKIVYSLVAGISVFFSMNCGSEVGGYGDSSSPPPAQSTNATEAASAKVVVNGHEFDPPAVHIKAGQSVRWEWVAGFHDVVSGSACTSDGQFRSGSGTEGPGSTFDHRFDAPGTYPYFCDPHCGIGMTGKVIVE
jgi:plastocyanin